MLKISISGYVLWQWTPRYLNQHFQPQSLPLDTSLRRLVSTKMPKHYIFSMITNVVSLCLFVILASLHFTSSTSIGAELHWQASTVTLFIVLIITSIVSLLIRHIKVLFLCNFFTPAALIIYLFTIGISNYSMRYLWILLLLIFISILLNLYHVSTGRYS